MVQNATIIESWLADIISKKSIGNTQKTGIVSHMGTLSHPSCNDMSILPACGLNLKDQTYELAIGAKLLIDKSLRKHFEEFMGFAYSDKVGEHTYKVCKTACDGVNDYDIVGIFRISEFTEITQMMACANHLIKVDLLEEEGGLMKGIANDNDQENLNLGYYEGEYGKMKMVFLEKKKTVAGESPEYHIHESDVPRDFYKGNRYFLISA